MLIALVGLQVILWVYEIYLISLYSYICSLWSFIYMFFMNVINS